MKSDVTRGRSLGVPHRRHTSCYSDSSSLSFVLVIAAFCRNSVDGQWYSYDDSSAEPVPEAEVVTRGAYILFYQRRNTIPPWSASSSLTG